MPDANGGSAGGAFPFDNSFARLPPRLFERLAPTAVAAPSLLLLNDPLAATIGLDAAALRTADGVAALAGNLVPAGAEPLAMAYAGHQFGHFVPQLGDGRALLLGEVVGPDGVRRDIQLKGAGPTPFSRMGDGRCAVGPALREYVVSEGMAALGIPTTRSLAVVASGERILREGPRPGAVLTRVARSHVRVGSFQYWRVRDDVVALRALADHVISRNHPGAAGAAHPYRALLAAVVAANARLVASWLGVGFIHGVMNTDNVSVAGETIDYGPCAFMDGFDAGRVLSSIDHAGRYSYGNQPAIMQWNLTRLAEALLPLLGDDADTAVAAAQEALGGYGDTFNAAWAAVLRGKLGLRGAEDGDAALAEDLLDRMGESGADFTLAFRLLADAQEGAAPAAFTDLFGRKGGIVEPWLERWRARLGREGGPSAARAEAMRATNPIYIPRNHLVEDALSAAEGGRGLGRTEALLAALAAPFTERPDLARYALPPEPGEVVQATFCGT